jgi:hypothetical protein
MSWTGREERSHSILWIAIDICTQMDIHNTCPPYLSLVPFLNKEKAA